MARVISSFPEGARGRPTKYPWTTWLDGNPWELKPGEDFHTSVWSFRSALTRQAQKAGLKARTAVTNNDAGERVLVVQAYKEQ